MVFLFAPCIRQVTLFKEDPAKDRTRNQTCLLMTGQCVTLYITYLSWASLKWPQPNTAITKTTSLILPVTISLSSSHASTTVCKTTWKTTRGPVSLNNNEEWMGKFLKWFIFLIQLVSGDEIREEGFSMVALVQVPQNYRLRHQGSFMRLKLHKYSFLLAQHAYQAFDQRNPAPQYVSGKSYSPDFQVEEIPVWGILPRGNEEPVNWSFHSSAR